jgi:DNA-directed RNA polymerase subunit F
MTHTYAILEVTPGAYEEIRTRLEAGGYADAFHRDDGQEVIDLHGLALKATGPLRPGTIEVASILSRRTRRGIVGLVVDGRQVQLEIAKAKEVVALLQGAIEAATSDEMFFSYLTERAKLSPEEAGRELLELRELRQGSKDTVFPT